MKLGPRAHTSSPETRSGSRGPLLVAGAEASASRAGLLSWGSSKTAPPPGSARVRPLPDGSEDPPFGASLPSSARVPPLSFRRLRRFAPKHDPQVYCNLHRSWGSPRFRLPRDPRGSSGSLPLWRSALRSFSLCGSRRCVTARPCPPAVTRVFLSRSTHVATGFPFVSLARSASGLCSTAEAVASRRVATTRSSLLPWAFPPKPTE